MNFLLSTKHHMVECFHYMVGLFFTIKKDKVFFDSFPDYSDNARALSDYLLEHSDYNIYWAVKHIPSYETNPRIHFILKEKKWHYIYHTLTAKYLFSTHSAFYWANPKRQIYICLWHGTMLKRVAYMQDPVRNRYCNRNARYFVSPSYFYKSIFAQSFNRNEKDVLLTGYPRIDFLLTENDSLEKISVDKTMFKKIIMYLPTFRQPVSGGYSDTNTDIFKDNLINFSDNESLSKWNSFFRERGILLIVKPHPSDKNQLTNIRLSNIIVIPHHTLAEKDIQLYCILRYANALITDYSSVFCDYLVLDRPIGFILSDIDEYTKGRGFVFQKPLDVLPGNKIWNEADFTAFCDEVSQGIDSTKQLRNKMQSMYNKYITGSFCKRIADTINMNTK